MDNNNQIMFSEYQTTARAQNQRSERGSTSSRGIRGGNRRGGGHFRGNRGSNRGSNRWSNRGNNRGNLDGWRAGRGGVNSRDERRERNIPFMRLKEWAELTDLDDLLISITGNKEQLQKLLNLERLSPDWCYLLLSVFCKVTQMRSSQTKVAILSLLRDSQFLSKHLTSSLMIWEDEKECHRKNVIAWLFQLIEGYFELFPSACSGMPLDQLANFIDDDDEEGVKMIAELRQRRKDLIKNTMVVKKVKKLEAFTNEPPPDNFRDIPTAPSAEDIHRTEKAFLRPIKEKGGYLDGEQYLDVQFRLLREDLVAPLRAGVIEIVSGVPKREKKYGLKVYSNVKVIFPLATNNGIIYRVLFDTKNTQGIFWQHSRRLIHGSLLCLSKDGFKTMVFATVANRDPKNLEQGLIDVRFNGGVESQRYFARGEVLEMVESSAFFEAYKHVLDGMKELEADKIPLARYIVECSSDVKAPQYLRRLYKPEYKMKKSLDMDRKTETIEVLNDDSWPDFKETSLNESQLDAVKHALTKEFVVIQGPPGTGKTHVGIRIADALLMNKKYWNVDKKTPMLIVCYTNHALDQFVQGMIDFGHTNVIRVGGRANEDMQMYSLRYATAKLRDEIRTEGGTRHLLRAKAQTLEERDNVKEKIEELTEYFVKTQEKCLNGILVHLKQVQHVMEEAHLDYFLHLDQECKRIKVSVFDLFLQLLNVPPEEITRYVMIDISTQIEEDKVKEELLVLQNAEQVVEGIDIEGEGQVQVDRWVEDTDVYKVDDKKKKDKKKKEEKTYNDILRDNEGFEIVQPSRYKLQQKVRQNLAMHYPMTGEEVKNVVNPWELNIRDRWRLYKYWLQQLILWNSDECSRYAQELEDVCERVRELQDLEDEIALQGADIISMTTTCSARRRDILERIKPKVVIIEEAAEVLEAHVLTSLNTGLEHLILIGDHQQLKPSPEMYELAIKYKLELSLFKRMVDNGMQCHTLNIQHRMQPEISKLLNNIYPTLRDHPSVRNCPKIKGVNKNVVFINHNHEEVEVAQTKSKSNPHEAEFLKSLCRYLLQQGYKQSQITILTGYAGQLIEMKKIMPKDSLFSGVRVTAVDNFQGEENDIILLSLVRSNKNSSIGFMRTDNRICVALSRAKHGLYVIGNFDMLQEKSELWKKIVEDVKEMGSFCKSLNLYCRNHPGTRTSVTCGKDFQDAPEGGCTKPCDARLDCGHVCRMACHPLDPEHEEYICQQLCGRKTCESDHRCSKKCHYGNDCGSCVVRVEKFISECEHVQKMPCHQDPATFNCRMPCEKLLGCGHRCVQKCFEECSQKCYEKVEKKLACGHKQIVSCHLDPTEVECRTPCNSLLDCDHQCSGTCGICKMGRLHKKCSQKCERPLICTHLCKQPCTKDCPLCSEVCENRCTHGKCKKRCGEVCPPCREKCQWECEHLKCTKECGEQCDRGPCNERCKELIGCGHACIGICGETCPELCRVCHADQVTEIFFGTEDEEDALFLVLEDCQHVFEVTGLDNWMAMEQTSDSTDVKLKVCPKCKTPIRTSLRYGNIVKNTLNDLNEVKKKIKHGGGDTKALSRMKEKTYQVLKKINRILIEMSESSKVKIAADKRLREACVCSTELIQNGSLKEFSAGIKHRMKETTDNHAYAQKRTNVASELAEKLSSPSLSYQEIEIFHQRAQMLKEIWKLKKEIVGSNHLRETYVDIITHKDLCDLEKLLTSPVSLSHQQLEQANNELERYKIYVRVMICRKALVSGTTSSHVDDIRAVEILKRNLDKPAVLEQATLAKCDKGLKILENRYSVNGLSDQLKLEIVKAIGLGKGHWYKCPNGHFYAIGECGGATQTGKCPDCGSTVGGTGHSLLANNRHAGEFDGSNFAAYSEEANNVLNFDPEQLRQLRI